MKMHGRVLLCMSVHEYVRSMHEYARICITHAYLCIFSNILRICMQHNHYIYTRISSVQGSWFRVQGSGFRARVQGSGFRVYSAVWYAHVWHGMAGYFAERCKIQNQAFCINRTGTYIYIYIYIYASINPCGFSGARGGLHALLGFVPTVRLENTAAFEACSRHEAQKRLQTLSSTRSLFGGSRGFASAFGLRAHCTPRKHVTALCYSLLCTAWLRAWICTGSHEYMYIYIYGNIYVYIYIYI